MQRPLVYCVKSPFTLFVIPGLTRNPVFLSWIPAFSEMTASYETIGTFVQSMLNVEGNGRCEVKEPGLTGTSCTNVPSISGYDSVSQRFFGQKIGEVSRPVHIKWRTIWPYPVLFRARPVCFPKRAAPSGIGDIHHFHHRNPLNVNKLVQNKILYNRRNYHIII